VLAVLYAPNYVALVVAVTLFGVIGQMYRPASAALISELTPAHRQVMIFAMHRLALNLGTSAAPLLGAALFAFSYDLLFWGQAAAAVGYAIIALIALPKHTPITKAKPGADAPVTPHGTGYRAVLVDKRFVLFLGAFLINSVVYLQHVSALPLAMRDAGLPVIWYGAMITMNAVIVITCELLATKVVQTWQMRTAAAVGFALLGAGMAVYALPGGVAIFVIGTLTWTLAEIVAGPTMFAYSATAAPPGLRGRYIGTSQAVFGIGTAIGPPAGVAIWYGAGDALWVLCGLVCLLGIGAVWVGMRPTNPAEPANLVEPTNPVESNEPAESGEPTGSREPDSPADQTKKTSETVATAHIADAANMAEPEPIREKAT
jgi:MFS family permease